MKTNYEKLMYYCYDIDDNLVYMKTPIFVDKLHENEWLPQTVNSNNYVFIKYDENYRLRNNNFNKAFEEFRDEGTRGDNAFLYNLKEAIDNKEFGPSWNSLLKCLKEGSIFALATARGHNYNSLKKGIEYIIDNCLNGGDKKVMYENCFKFLQIFNENSNFILNKKIKFSQTKLIQEYLKYCRYYSVSSDDFNKEFNTDNSMKIEEKKKLALDKFINECVNYGKIANKKISLGFSDDDINNVEHIKSFFEYKSMLEDIKLCIYDTSNKGMTKSVIENTATNITNDNSILRFIGINGMNNNLQNSTNDFTGYEEKQREKSAEYLYDKIPKKKRKFFLKKKKKD